MDYINDQLQIVNKFSSLISLIDHIYPPLMCALCDTAFSSEKDLLQHHKERHSKESKYLCIHPHCQKRFKSKGALRFHLSNAHIVNQTKGPLLDSPFINYTHNNLISSNAPSANDKLSQINTTASFFISSIPTASSFIHRKKEKKQIFSSPVLEDLTPSPPPSPFSLYHHQRHRKQTLSQKAEKLLNGVYPPLQCPSCHQMFNRKTNVIKHLTEAHVGEEPYRCIYPKCNHPKMYATREGLVYHIVRVHDQKK
ncbi:hypothetical protein BDF20DRAFT_814956 [Mycotypha africana]|uniref:uncharacterized protein n=1 Tax=Mycotypha africana TaxID=64632 RepID=UPI002300E361|nr:uncharacterized protein BDF20DRAFT_814956 [Mycotypha africana]KAI8987347.1 hypothetical protein BDF20DRAFT_814956 [Mycotypha africana]